jgi:hypothetical protein
MVFVQSDSEQTAMGTGHTGLVGCRAKPKRLLNGPKIVCDLTETQADRGQPAPQGSPSGRIKMTPARDPARVTASKWTAMGSLELVGPEVVALGWFIDCLVCVV